MTFSFAPISEVLQGAPDIVQPFTMTGSFFPSGLFGPVGFDVFGEGQMSLLWRTPQESLFPMLTVRFDFTEAAAVPEAPTLLLLAGTLATTALWRRRTRKGM
jgi:hypothetical protein